ncbi:hypothetical protein S675_005726 [Salmonella enterica subsp. enterica]|nr:hypothetical protein [Salmonella enterica subsp. enterica]
MIIPNTTTLGEQSRQATATTPNLADLISGRFGLLHAKDAPICENLDTAMIGYMLVTPDTKGNPQSGDLAYGQCRRLIHSAPAMTDSEQSRQWENLKSG